MRTTTHPIKFWIAFPIISALVSQVVSFLSAAHAQTYLYNHAQFPTGDNPVAAIVADFNRDGVPDVAAVNKGDDTVSVLLGKPDAGLAPKVDYPVGDSPLALADADFNGDGNLDLVVTNQGTNTFSLLFGNGDGTFQAQVERSTGPNPLGIVAADFNGDAKTDLAILSQGNSAVWILLGDGDGTFQIETPFSVDANPVALASGDFNGDGELDLITSNDNRAYIYGDGSVSVLLGNGVGAFARVDSVGGYAPGAIAVGNFSSDSKLDVVIVNQITQLSVLVGIGDGSFQFPGNLPVRPTFSATSILAVDANRDGRLDILATAGYQVTLLNGKAGGGFQEGAYVPSFIGLALASADFNGDGLFDLLFGQNSSDPPHSLHILLGNGIGGFRSGNDYDLPPVSLATNINAGPLAVADFNGDGKPDLAVVESEDPEGSIAVLLATGSGSFSAPLVSPISATSFGWVVAGDFNGDGSTDLAGLIWYSATSSNAVAVFFGLGNGRFQAPLISPFPSGTLTPCLTGDFNGDGKQDIAVTVNDDTGKGVGLLLGKGDGTFLAGPSTYLPGPYRPQSVSAGDFNHDGKLDLATADGNSVFVLIGDGNGTFQNPVFYDCYQLGISDIKVDSFDQDGNLDLIAIRPGGVSFFRGNGDGSFQPPLDSDYGRGLGAIVVGDFSGDGYLDFASKHGTVVVIGKGDGTFHSPQSLGLFPSDVGAGDFNSDGIADLALVNHFWDADPFVSIALSSPFPAFFPAHLDFGEQEVGTTSTAQEVTLTNIGNAPMTVTGITPSSDYSEINSCGGTIPIGAICTISVTFAPVAHGPRAGTLVITDNIATSPQAISLTGIGLAPLVNLSPSELVFGSQSLDTTSLPLSATLSNAGSVSLIISSIDLSGDFAATDNCGVGLAGGSICTINVTFTPTENGTRTGTLTISDNAPDTPHTIALTGSGPDFTLAASVGSSTTATVTAGQTATYSLNIAPVSGFDQKVSFTCSGAPQRTTCTVLPSSVTPDGTKAATITVSVATTARSISGPQIRVPPVSRLGKPWAVLLVMILVAVAAASNRRPISPALTSVLQKALLPFALLVVLFWVACGGGSSGGSGGGIPGTPAGTYSLTVTGTYTSGTTMLQRTIILSLKVN